MPSVENFYWILFENLLRPVELDCWYFYPFGTQNNLSRGSEFMPWHPKNEHHVLFGFDQEPIWQDHCPLYDGRQGYTNKLLKIVANSEHSLIKKNFCRSRNASDWYFFYHGFAALDWFGDTKFLDWNNAPNKVFTSLNHIVTDLRAYRLALTAKILQRNLHHCGDLSLHASRSSIGAELDNPYSRLSDQEKQVIQTNLVDKGWWALTVDQPGLDATASAQLGHREYKLWQNSFVHLVNETVFYDEKLHLTEKIFKPIVALRPFLLAAAPGNLAYLRNYGFKTFGEWWDESYDAVQDPGTRSDLILDILDKLCVKSPAELKKMLEEMKPVLEFNKHHFFGEFRKIIVEELVNNFDTCIRSWNNGRVDGRERPLHPDLQSVKQTLLR